MPRSTSSARSSTSVRSSAAAGAHTSRAIRFPGRLRARIADDAERCGRTFEAQVVAILRRHYGEDVDIAPAPDVLLDLAVGSLAGISEADRVTLTRRLGAEEAGD
jgi:hypothetical protein